MKKTAIFVLSAFFLMTNMVLFGAPKALPKGPGAVFLEGASLEFALTDCPAGTRYTVKDWLGKEVYSGVFPAVGETLVLPQQPRGYYVIEATDLRQDFCVVATPEAHGAVDGKLPPRPNSVLAVDTAQTWLAHKSSMQCPWYDGDGYRLTCDLVYWAGIPQIRDRLAWHDAMPTKDAIGPGFQRYLRNSQMLRERGVKVSGMYHDAASWSGCNPSLPRDMIAAYTFAKTMAEQFGDCMADWEFWNEEDIGFALEPVWDYASAMKASALGFRAGNPEVLVGNGAIALGPASGPYPDKLFENEIGKYIDFYNYHTYNTIITYGNVYDTNRAFLSAHGLYGMPIWCTESGVRQEGEARQASLFPQYSAHSPEQEMIQAEFYPKSQIGHWFQGCTKNFWFVFCPLNEAGGVKDWGLMRRDGSVKPTYAAISTMTLHLADATLAGQLNTPAGIRAYLFDLPDGTQTICYWSETELDTNPGVDPMHFDNLRNKTFKLALPKGTYATSNMVGTQGTLVVNQDITSLEAIRYPAYIAGLSGLQADILPISQGTNERYAPAEDEDLTVILRVDLNPEDFRVENVKTNAVMTGTTGRMTIEIWNLDDKAKTGSLLVDGATLEGLPDTITLPAMGKVAFPVTLVPFGNNGLDATDMILTGLFDERYSSRLLMPYICESLAQWKEIPLNANRPEAWGQNSSADIQKISWDETENAVRFDVKWVDEMKDRWFYPFYALELPQESMDGAIYLQFEVKMTQDKIENDVACAYVMLQQSNGQDYEASRNVEYPAPIENWESRRIRVQMDGVDASRIAQFKIGCNPRGKQMTYWIRNLKIRKAK